MALGRLESRRARPRGGPGELRARGRLGRHEGDLGVEKQSARDAAGNPLAAFDPAQPVTVHFTMLGGESRQASGTLPLHHALVLNENEYRFTLRPGAQGFATITAERCDYP